MHSILVPIDYAKASRHALHYASHIARMFQSRLIMSHAIEASTVVPVQSGIGASFGQQEDPFEIAQTYLDDLERSIPSDIAKHIEVVSHVAMDNPCHHVLSHCEQTEPTLIVLGVQESKKKGVFELGTFCKNLIRKSKWPILLVPEGSQFAGISNIGYPTDFEDDDIKVVDRLLEFAFLYEAIIHCIYIKQDHMPAWCACHDELKGRYKDDILLKTLSFNTLANDNMINVLSKHAHSQNMDMLAIPSRQKGALGQVLQANLNQSFKLESPAPILIFGQGH
ncbi:MAG: universal stress protein [Bacteroidia bacterium]